MGKGKYKREEKKQDTSGSYYVHGSSSESPYDNREAKENYLFSRVGIGDKLTGANVHRGGRKKKED
jgi:hypothetical protein